MDGDDMGGDDTVISADDTVIWADETIVSVPVDETVIEPDLEDTAFAIETSQAAQAAQPTEPIRRITAGANEAAHVPRPTVIFVLRLVTGARYTLTSAVVVGRAPRVARHRTGEVVQLVSVPSREGRVSSTHAELRQVGDVVVVTDLRSTNGTRVTLPSGVMRQLAPGDSMTVGEGSVVDVGDGNRIEVLREKTRDASNDIAR